MKKIIGQSFLAAIMALGGANVYALPFTVDAKANSITGGVGLNTGIVLTAGQAFTATAGIGDLWSAGPLPRWSNADGLVGNLLATGSDESGQVANTLIGQNFGLITINGLSAPFGSLVGELSGTYFKLGTSFSGTASVGGTLKLFYWDGFSGDNEGTVVANISKSTAVPEPSSFLLLILGLYSICLAVHRRRTA